MRNFLLINKDDRDEDEYYIITQVSPHTSV